MVDPDHERPRPEPPVESVETGLNDHLGGELVCRVEAAPESDLLRTPRPAPTGRDGEQVDTPTHLDCVVKAITDGVVELQVTPSKPTAVRVAWTIPGVDLVALWVPDSGRQRGLPPSWGGGHVSSVQRDAPVGSLIGGFDRALCTYASAEVVEPVLIRSGIVEETALYRISLEQHAGPDHPARVRIDLSGRGFAATLADIADWWAAGRTIPAPPPVARRPVYSTWYSMHQHVNAVDVERQVELAARLGCGSVIVDDGWMTTDRQRGYGHCGAWEPATETFPDMAGHVARVHQHGLAYLLWYAVPFVGTFSDVYDRFAPYTLAERPGMNAIVVDPRYPQVREWLVDKFAEAIEDWGMDGLKLDFIDQFAVSDPPEPGPEADCRKVDEGVRRLFAALDARIRDTDTQRPIEFRQPYVSPGLWPYASMLRAGDCPLSPLKNRQRTIDLRLIAGPMTVHADMMMWHPDEPAEQVAVQLQNALFSVPQISVDLAAQTADQWAVLEFWSRFVIEHADVLQQGGFEPHRPDLNYPLVRAWDEQHQIVARYAPLPVELPSTGWRRAFVANADPSSVTVITDTSAEARVLDCRGTGVGTTVRVEPVNGRLGPIDVPLGGLLQLSRLDA